ncbi:MAG: PIN domain-containing protein [Candidatus Parabeggiatoa sp.]|nr:PIN domain-containing protein [Candidatus Parabeggiatoa sp.]
MNDKPFFMDTNIFIYAYSTQDAVKRDIATKLVSSGQVMSSVQTLNELCNVLRKKFPATYAYAEDILSEIKALLPVVPLNHETTEIALKISKRYQFNFYDSLILASAIQHNCKSVLTEDLQDGFSLEGGLTIINPFLLK